MGTISMIPSCFSLSIFGHLTVQLWTLFDLSIVDYQDFSALAFFL